MSNIKNTLAATEWLATVGYLLSEALPALR